MKCHICTEEIVDSAEPVFRQITGWEEIRKGGGANQIHLRKTTGAKAHGRCIDAAKYASDKARVELDRYREAMGEEATDRQLRETRLARGQCVCHKRTVKVRGLFRTLHARECPKWKPYMAEVERDLEERRQASSAMVDSVRPEV